MTVQRLQPSHASAYRALMLQAYAEYPDAFTSSAAERAALPLSWWEARLSTESAAKEMVLGAFVDDVLAGVVGLSFETREKARHKATLMGMAVSEQHQKRGLGRALVLAALEAARQRAGLRVVQLTVTQGNQAAQSLYQRCGFLPFGVEPFAVAVGERFVSKVHMWCPLAPPAVEATAADSLNAMIDPGPPSESDEELIAQASACLDRFTACFNALDTAGMERELHFPHTLLSGGEQTVWAAPGQHPQNFFDTLRATGWSHTRYEAKVPVLVSRDKLHFVVGYTRRNRDDQVLSLHKNLWIVTRVRGHWGIVLRSY